MYIFGLPIKLKPMKFVCSLFVVMISLTAFSQGDTIISVISAEKLNVVYRGIPNPIKIAVPGAKSFVATGPGLVKTDSIGNYKLITRFRKYSYSEY